MVWDAVQKSNSKDDTSKTIREKQQVREERRQQQPQQPGKGDQ